MSMPALEVPRFVRRTQLGPHEYRKNFRQIDGDVISAVTSPEADRVTPLMSKIYLRLVNAPAQYWERDGVLRFEGELRDNVRLKAWDILCATVGVASATASKALRWMHGQGIIGYYAGKNGVGIRIFLNRATSSIGIRAAGKKILEFPRASFQEARAATVEAGFNDNFVVSEASEKDLNPRAPKSGAEQTRAAKMGGDSQATVPSHPARGTETGAEAQPPAPLRAEVPLDEVVARLSRRLEPALEAAARLAAAQEHERTREWLESRGLPKAARVAQRETYNVLRRYGLVTETARGTHADVGRGDETSLGARTLTDDEVAEMAQACVAMLEAQGRAVEVTLSEMRLEAGGFLLPGDAVKVRAKVQSMLAADGDNSGS